MGQAPTNAMPIYMAVDHARYLDNSIIDPDPANFFPVTTAGVTLNKSLIQLVNEHTASNPYASVFAYDPSSDLGAMTTANRKFEEAVDALNPTGDWSTYVQLAKGYYDGAFGNFIFNDMIEAKYREALKRMQIEASRFTAGMADINAVHTDAFVRGLAMMEGDLLASLRDEKLNLEMLDKQMYLDFIRAAVQAMMYMQAAKVDDLKTLGVLAQDVSKAAITAQSNYYSQEADLIVNEAKWQLDGFGEIGSFLGAINGAPRMSGVRQTPLQQFITTAMPIAAMTGSAGAMVAGPIGGAVGMLAGVLATGLYQMAGN